MQDAVIAYPALVTGLSQAEGPHSSHAREDGRQCVVGHDDREDRQPERLTHRCVAPRHSVAMSDRQVGAGHFAV